jgi:hypothetical protein
LNAAKKTMQGQRNNNFFMVIYISFLTKMVPSNFKQNVKEFTNMRTVKFL